MTVVKIVPDLSGVSIPDSMSVEQGAEIIASVATQLERMVHATLLLKWQIGQVVSHLEGGLPEVMHLSEVLWTNHGIRYGKSAMYEAAAVYRAVPVLKDYIGMIQAQRTRKEGTVYWSDIKRITIGGDNPRVIGADAHRGRLMRQVEQGLRAMERLAHDYADAPELESAITSAIHSLQEAVRLLPAAGPPSPASPVQ